jgi:hypothetical protein
VKRISLFLSFCLAIPQNWTAAQEVDRSATPPASIAKIKVAEAQAADFLSSKDWKDVPPFLAGAKVYEPSSETTNVLQFEVEEGGVVLLAVSWTADGDNSMGDWRKGRASTSSLVREGWVAIAADMHTMLGEKPDPHYLFRRVVNAGESYRLHTRQVHAPLLILPAADRLAEIVALPAIVELQPSGSPRWNLNWLGPRFGTPPAREFTEEAIPGRVLVGLRVTTDFAASRLGICSLQAIYENRDGRVRGAEFGQPGATAIELEARAGYVVGTIRGSSGRNVSGLQLVFMRRTAGGLDPSDSYLSRWAGLRNSDAEVKLGGDGRAFGGLKGKADEATQGVSLIPAVQ